MVDINALFSISYGLYVVSAGNKEKGNAYISNTVFQVTAEPIKFATCCNKDNYTADLIAKSGGFAVSVLSQETPSDLIGNFGYKSGKDHDKLTAYTVSYGQLGMPIIQDYMVATMEFKVLETIDVGTHLMFIGEVVETKVLSDNKPMTYEYYRAVKKGVAPKNAPTYIDKSKLGAKSKEEDVIYKCAACGYEHHIAEGDASKGIEPGTNWEDIPEDYTCPLCGIEKEEFYKL